MGGSIRTLINFDTRVPERIVSVLKEWKALPNVSVQLFGKTKITDSAWFELEVRASYTSSLRPHTLVA
jgi:hypothetical protein